MVNQIPLFLACFPLLAMQLVAQDASLADVQDLSTRNADFATRLYRAIASSTDANVLVSPITVSLGLAALMSGADGATREQLSEALSFMSLDIQTIPGLFESLQVSLNQNGEVGLKQAVGVVVDQKFTVAEDYDGLVQNKYGGKVVRVDFSSPEAARTTINTFTQSNTGEQVKDVLSASPDAATKVMLVTGAFFQAPFALAFNATLTQDERFYVDKYHIAMVPMMFRSDKYHLAYDPSLKLGVLKLPMSGGAAMLVLLPDENTDCTAVEEEVTADRFKGWVMKLKRTRLEVQLPKFLLEQSYSLKRVLPALAIRDTDNLSAIGGVQEDFMLSEVVHKVAITADETGGAPGGGMDMFTSPPPRLTINRPFLFLIYHEKTSSILLMGRVVDPTKK
ncbi:serpin peptidase inhibitor, clade A (alpha-1 antiproteinase, antitrypsin), member 10a [Osmerus eperlanus]|uniref:serpin peptidase inhibitor, clade A (alpha-1 antiproteinase, antitrypsin), member 10a n=1 Tax=Osmerus eperlanus TaxID=29151 RepID=UPI002E15CE38